MRGTQRQQTNIIHRHPELAELLGLPTADADAGRWANWITPHHPSTSNAVEIGCWIGMVAKRLTHWYEGTGGHVQPHLIEYAREHRPGPRLVVEDIATTRLDYTVRNSSTQRPCFSSTATN
ncbi:hypothetical protein [Kutzneria albida]|uniref:hypothetical protein n=1 Tax=Kutzneria albida TaxID=43357 RepID=UPI0011DCD69E|nr:hypothetical protein [Kutzneria albida]